MELTRCIMCAMSSGAAHGLDGGDVWGAILRDARAGRRAAEIVERDDGFVVAYDAAYLLAPYEEWDDPVERESMAFVRGRVLDVGCGGGRVALYLQDRGHEVVAIDPSPGAIEICSARGVRDARVLGVDGVDASLGRFDTIIMLGQNFGLLQTPDTAERVLRRWRGFADRIVAETFDPYALPDNASYRERNIFLERREGALRVRVRYREHATEWHEWLQVSREELRALADRSGWRLEHILGDGPSYIGILDAHPPLA
jgi:SAM-dependent methyltransferase